MKNKVMVDLIKDKNIVIPLYLYKLRNKLSLSMDEFMVLMYLYNEGELILFDLNKIGTDLGIDHNGIMNIISTLSNKNLIELKVITNDKNIKEEYISLSNFYNRVSLMLMDRDNDEEKRDDSNIFELIEQEFGRTLSPIEYEIIKAWLENNFSVELIKCALKEAVMSGVGNLRYIDKILYEWSKKGIKTKKDVENYTESHRKKTETPSKKVEVFDWDEWLDEDDS